MKMYLGVKLIEAESMSEFDFRRSKGITPSDKEVDKEGYKVTYEDGYTSWSPKEVFEKAYREVTNLTFGLAIEALKLGKCVARIGWNGKGMFVCKQIPSEISREIIPKMQSLPQGAKDMILSLEGEGIKYRNQMLIVNNNVADSWVPSSSDVFAEDWFIVE